MNAQRSRSDGAMFHTTENPASSGHARIEDAEAAKPEVEPERANHRWEVPYSRKPNRCLHCGTKRRRTTIKELGRKAFLYKYPWSAEWVKNRIACSDVVEANDHRLDAVTPG